MAISKKLYSKIMSLSLFCKQCVALNLVNSHLMKTNLTCVNISLNFLSNSSKKC